VGIDLAMLEQILEQQERRQAFTLRFTPHISHCILLPEGRPPAGANHISFANTFQAGAPNGSGDDTAINAHRCRWA
jgi:hypothetical protein